MSIRPHEETLRESAVTSGQVGVVTRRSNEVANALEQEDYGAAATALSKAVAELAKRLETVANADFTSHNQLVQRLAGLSEENNILWWVIGDYSRELGRPRGQASPQGLVLPSAYELASLVTHDAPPTASIEYLRYVLSSAEGETPSQLTVAEAMEATTSDWRDSATATSPEEDPDHLFPVLAGLRLMRETPTGEWGQALLDRTGLSTEFADAPENVGLQFLHELLLTRCLDGA